MFLEEPCFDFEGCDPIMNEPEKNWTWKKKKYLSCAGSAKFINGVDHIGREYISVYIMVRCKLFMTTSTVCEIKKFQILLTLYLKCYADFNSLLVI